MKSFEEMLKAAEEKLPKEIKEHRRLVIPKPEVHIQGNQTFFMNFEAISEVCRRDPKHIAKFLFRELAIPGHIEGKRLVFQGKVSPSLLEKKIENYVKEFIYCKECDRPDTKLSKEDRITLMICEACGSKKSVRNI